MDKVVNAWDMINLGFESFCKMKLVSEPNVFQIVYNMNFIRNKNVMYLLYLLAVKDLKENCFRNKGEQSAN